MLAAQAWMKAAKDPPPWEQIFNSTNKVGDGYHPLRMWI
jgi:hypothetical protein